MLDLSIRQRLGLGLGLLLLVLAGLLAIAVYGHSRSSEAQTYYTDTVRPRAEVAQELENAVLHVAVDARRFLISPSPARHQAYLKRRSSAEQAARRFASVPKEAEGRALENEILPHVDHFLQQADALVASRHSRTGGEALLDDAEMVSAREAALEHLEAFRELQADKAAGALGRMARARLESATGLGVGAGVSLILFIGLGLTIVAWVRRPVRELVGAARALERGDYAAARSVAPSAHDSTRAEPRSEMAVLGRAFGSAAQALQRREERLATDGAIARAASGSLDKARIAEEALAEIVAFASVEVAIVYGWDAERELLFPLATHATDGQTVRLGEGVPGQAAFGRKPVILRDLPTGAGFEVKLGYDQAPPRAVAAVPILSRSELLGVVLVASLRDLGDEVLAFLEQAGVALGMGLRNVKAFEEIEALLVEIRAKNQEIQAQNEEIQAQSEEVQAQNEEIQAQNEEIQAQNEEVQAQSEEIQAQSEEIRTQNEEVRRANEDLQRHAAELERITRELRDADMRKNEFLGVLAHELRNPMAPISNSLFIVQRAGADSPQSTRALAVIERQVRHLTRLIDDLLDVTRISRGKVKLEARRLELGELVRACVEDHRADIEAKALTVRVAHRESLWVDGDSTRLCQIIGNLLNNAVKYTPPGGAIEVTLREETAQGDRRAVLSVKDSGAGITAELMPCIFEPFQQGVSTIDRANGGLGLGLALVKGLVELHQGEVVGKSDGDGKGSEFVVQLPLRAPPSSPVREARPPLSGAQRKCRVLVVEDNVDAAESLREVLELGGHVVDLAFSGGEGIEKAKLLRPDVVLCDIGLPNVNGYDVARKLRADPALDATLLVALTGYAGPSDRERAAEAGFDEHLAKPPNLKKLSVLLERVIAGVDCAN